MQEETNIEHIYISRKPPCIVQSGADGVPDWSTAKYFNTTEEVFTYLNKSSLRKISELWGRLFSVLWNREDKSMDNGNEDHNLRNVRYYWKNWKNSTLRISDRNWLHSEESNFQLNLAKAASLGCLFELLQKADVDPQTLELLPEGKTLIEKYYEDLAKESLPFELRQE